MKNYYQTLGVEQTASPEEIKRAYRKLASLYHPDKEGGSKTKFQEVEEAYRTLSDDQKRAQYDNPGMGGSFGFHPGAPFDFETIFNVFGTRFQHPGQQRRQQARMSLWITLRDVAEGGNKTISVGTHQGTSTIEIEIPKGISDGDSVQYNGVGPGGIDLIITYRIHPDPKWQRQDLNLIAEHPVSVWDLIVGGETEIRDLLGNVLSLTISPRTQPGTVLRLRNRGLQSRNGASGDLLIKIQARIPDSISPELVEQIQLNQTK
jgi:curved DNA-binding protein